MKISANDIKSGTILDYNGELWLVTKNPEHTKPGKGPAYIQVEMKNIKTGTKLNTRFSSTESLERAFLEGKDMQFLYKEDGKYIFMDQESFEQIELKAELFGDKLPLLENEMIIKVEFYQDAAITVKFPTNMIVEVEQTDPVIKGSTVTSSYKPAILTNGIRVMVPPYLNTGEKIVIKTEDLTFVERAK